MVHVKHLECMKWNQYSVNMTALLLSIITQVTAKAVTVDNT